MTTLSDRVGSKMKLRLALEADLPDLRAVVSRSIRQPEQQLLATYFDTSDMRLWERGITLRHLSGEGLPTWSLLLPRPSSGKTRKGTDRQWPGEEDHVPAPAVDALAGVVRRGSLQKIAEMHIERIPFVLEVDGVTRAELAHDVVSVVGGRTDGLRFRQLDLEIVDGGDGQADVDLIINALRRAGARPERHPDLERAVGPPPKREKLGRRSSAEAVGRHAVSSGFDRLLDHDCRIRLDGPDVDPEDVHQARVATRRLRSDLGTLGPLLDPVWVGHVRGDLRSVGDALGAVRDTDVLISNLIRSGAGVTYVKALGEERAVAVSTLRRVLNEPRYMDLLDRLHAASWRPPIADRRMARRKARRVLPSLVHRRWKRLRREVSKGGRHPGDDHLHLLRRRAKQLRYASELSIPVIGQPAKRTAKASESLQSVLGAQHDAVVAVGWLKEKGRGRGVETDPGLALLIEQHEQSRQRLSRSWWPRYRKLVNSTRHGWLDSGR